MSLAIQLAQERRRVRQLERTVNQLKRRLAPAPAESSGFVRRLVTQAATVFDATPTEILSHRRPRRIVEARMAVAAVAVEKGLSPAEVALVLHKDRTTVLYARRTVATFEAVDARFADKITRLRCLEKITASQPQS